MIPITNAIYNYRKDIPVEVALRAAQGFVATAAISLCLGSAIPVVLLGGAIAATATIIEAVTRPLFKALFSVKVAALGSISIAAPIALGLAASFAPGIGVTYRISSLFFSVTASYVLNCAIAENTDSGWAYVLV